MKKLSLKKLKLESSDLLQRNELKTVFGGNYGGYSCVTKGNGCNKSSTNSNNLCCAKLKCKVSAVNIGICVDDISA